MTLLIDYLVKFESSFIKELEAVDESRFSEAWASSRNRTKFYEDCFLEKVAKRMGLEFKTEDFKIDYTFCQKVDGYLVPEIFIESENYTNTAEHEVRKLCCLSAPLKVLITCVEWNDDPGYWKGGGKVEKYSQLWGKQIRAHSKVWHQNSMFLVIVAEWDKYLRFYSLAYDSSGQVIRENRKIFEM